MPQHNKMQDLLQQTRGQKKNTPNRKKIKQTNYFEPVLERLNCCLVIWASLQGQKTRQAFFFFFGNVGVCDLSAFRHLVSSPTFTTRWSQCPQPFLYLSYCDLPCNFCQDPAHVLLSEAFHERSCVEFLNLSAFTIYFSLFLGCTSCFGMKRGFQDFSAHVLFFLGCLCFALTFAPPDTPRSASLIETDCS